MAKWSLAPNFGGSFSAMPPKSPRQYKNIAVGNLNDLTKKSLAEITDGLFRYSQIPTERI